MAGLPGLVWLSPKILDFLPAMTISIFFCAVVVKIIERIQGNRPKHQHWLIKGTLALTASVPAILIQS